jgi:hypothetical protein
MTDIWLWGVVTEDHKLIVDVPDDVPPGLVYLKIRIPPSSEIDADNPARAAARAKLAAVGLLSSTHELPLGTRIPTDAKVEAAGELPPGARPSEELINEDREERF